MGEGPRVDGLAKSGSPSTIAGALLPASARRATDGNATPLLRAARLDRAAGPAPARPLRLATDPAVDGLAVRHRTPHHLRLAARRRAQRRLPGLLLLPGLPGRQRRGAR